MAIGYPEATKLLNAMVLGTTYTRPTSVIIEPYKSNDPPALDGTGGTPLGAGHTGKTLNLNGTNFSVTGKTFTNLVAITGDNNGSSTVTMTHVAMRRASDNSLMFVKQLAGPIEVASGNPWSIAIGDLDGGWAGAITDSWGNTLINHIVTGAAITFPTTDIELDLVSTAPSASAAGTQVSGTAYAPLSIPVGSSYWIVTNNVATLQSGLTPKYAVAGGTWSPRGVNAYKDSTGGVRMFFQDWGSSLTVNTGNQLGFDSDSETYTVKIAIDLV